MKTGILIPSVYEFVERASGILAEIPESRKVRLNKLVNFIQDRVDTGRTSNLIFICTHNSRRSLMAQILAKTAAVYCGIPGVECFSGGTETTEFNPRVVRAL
ncbi:MAG: protein-tyrosine-phosphatase, partial [Cyclobacteriaceae bacterium]